jgi:hypothetical protein
MGSGPDEVNNKKIIFLFESIPGVEVQRIGQGLSSARTWLAIYGTCWLGFIF